MCWQISFATASTAVSVSLQTAMKGVQAQYAVRAGAVILGSTLITVDHLVAPGVHAIFVRAKGISITGRSGVSVPILGQPGS